MRQLNVGVLALQGAISEHINQLTKLQINAVVVKRVEQLAQLDGLILPGGESTAIGKLMQKYDFIAAIADFSAKKKPIFGTCAGMILLAKQIEPEQPAHLKLMDIKVKRNAFGRQIDSFQTKLTVLGCSQLVDAVFIRAPYISELDASKVQVLASYQEKVVLAKQEHLLACAFHPELTNDVQVLQLFVEMVKTSITH